MKKVEKCEVFDLMLLRLREAADEPESVDLDDARVFMEVVAEAVQRGSADGAIGAYGNGAEYRTWWDIVEALEDWGIQRPAAAFVRESVHFAMDMLELPEVGTVED